MQKGDELLPTSQQVGAGKEHQTLLGNVHLETTQVAKPNEESHLLHKEELGSVRSLSPTGQEEPMNCTL